MANKQEKAIQRAVRRAEKRGVVREEKHVLAFLTLVILILLWLLFAQHNGWWPYSRPKLGSAFYTNISANTPAPEADESDNASTGNTDGNSTSNNNGTDGSNGSNGSDGSDGNDGSNGDDDDDTNTTPPASDSLIDFAAEINVGDTKTQIDGKAQGLGQGCAVVADVQARTVGKQEVCTYTEGDKIITVTYLNDRVISASKSGF